MSETELSNKKKEITEKIIEETTKKEELLTEKTKYVKVNSKNSKWIFLVILFLFISLIIFYIIRLISNKSTDGNVEPENTEFFFYNHTGFTNLITSGSCYSFPVDFINNTYVPDYKNGVVRQCLDSNLVTGIQGYRFCEYDTEKINDCLDFNGNIIIPDPINTKVEVKYNIDTADVTLLPTCNLKSCEGYIGRVISFIDKSPFCMTISPNPFENDTLLISETGFLPCDPNNINQLFTIENINADSQQDFMFRLFSRSTQQYLYIDSQGSLKLSDSFNPDQFWFYTPNVDINETTVMPSQLVFIDHSRIIEYANYESINTKGYIYDYSPLFDNANNLVNIKLDSNYVDVILNMFSLSPTGYLSSRQYVQFCEKNGIGNKACYREFMVISESDYLSRNENNTLIYEYTGVKAGS